MHTLLFFLLAAADPTAEEIVAKSIAAMGGADQFATVESVRVHARMRFGKEESFAPLTILAKRPAKLRMELTGGPDHVVQTYDGTTGWQSVSGEHKQPPTALTGESLAHLVDQAANAIGGPLLDLKKRGNRVEYVGREPVDGKDCFKIKVALPTGDSMVMFIDSSTYREIQEELPIQIDGHPGTIQQSLGNYRRFGPIWVACLLVTRQKGGEDTQRMEIDSVEINPPIEESSFKMSP